MPKFSQNDDIEMAHQAPPAFPTSSQGTSNGGAIFDPGTSNTNPGTMMPTMEYAPQMTVQPQQKIDYQISFCETSVPVQCPVCHQRSVSKTKPVAGGYTYVWAMGICAVCCLGCIPFCVKRLQNVEHRCGSCDEKLATWHRSQGRVDVHAWEGK